MSGLIGVMRSLERPLVKHVAAEGLTAMQFAVMERLLHKGEQTVNDIIDGVFSTSGNIGVVIDNLIKAGLLEKKVNPNDGRSRLIDLTKAGKEKISTYYPSHRNELRRLMSGIEPADKETLIRALIQLKQCVEKNNTQDLKGLPHE